MFDPRQKRNMASGGRSGGFWRSGIKKALLVMREGFQHGSI
jgi:hypothetical protein